MSNSSIDFNQLLTSAPPAANIPPAPTTSGTGDNKVTLSPTDAILANKVDVPGIIAANLKQFSDGVGVTANATQYLFAAGKQQAESQQQETAAIQASTAAKAQQIQMEQAASIAQKADITTALGGPGWADRRAAMTEQASENYNQVTSLGNEIAERSSVGFLDNPVQWLVNQIKLPQLQDSMQARMLTAEGQSQDIRNIDENQSASIQAAANVDTAASAAYTKALTDVNAAAGMQLQAQATEKAAQFGLQEGSVFDQVDRTGVEAWSARIQAGIGIMNAQTNYDYKEEQAARDKVLIQAEQSNQDAQNQVVAQVNPVLTSLGLPTISGYAGYQAMPQRLKNLVEDLRGGPQGSLGPTPATAFNNIQNNNLRPPGMDPLMNTLSQVRESAIQTYNKANPGQNYEKLAPQEKLAYDDNSFKTYINNNMSSVPETGFVMSPAPIKSYLASPVIAALPLIADYAKTANSSTPTSLTGLMSLAQEQIKSGKTTAAAAADQLNLFFKTVYGTQIQTSGLAKLGMSQTSGYLTPGQYNLQYVNNVGPYGTPGTLNVLSKSAIENQLIRAQAQNTPFGKFDTAFSAGFRQGVRPTGIVSGAAKVGNTLEGPQGAMNVIFPQLNTPAGQ